eukprot:464568_1
MANNIRKKYEPNCHLTMNLRSRNKNNNMIQYKGQCNVKERKIYANNRYDKSKIRNEKYRSNRKRSRSQFNDDCDSNKENIPPRKRRRKNSKWRNATKQPNMYRNNNKNINNASNNSHTQRIETDKEKQNELDEYITIINDKIND